MRERREKQEMPPSTYLGQTIDLRQAFGLWCLSGVKGGARVIHGASETIVCPEFLDGVRLGRRRQGVPRQAPSTTPTRESWFAVRDIASDDSAVGGAAPPWFGPWVGEGFEAVDLKWVAQISSSVSLGAFGLVPLDLHPTARCRSRPIKS